MEKRMFFAVGNWKMNPIDSAQAAAIMEGIQNAAAGAARVRTVVAPPHIFLQEIARRYAEGNIFFGAQDCFHEEKGAFTGAVSPTMIKGVGADYCIIGHSERRALGETNELVNRKVLAALRNGLTVILCVGEHERNESGAYLDFLSSELRECLARVSKKSLPHLMIAYEPIWAIGKSASEAMESRDVHETSLYLRKVLRDLFKTDAALAIPVLYGGSVAPENTQTIVRGGNVEGLLVGHKSIVPEQFSEIIRLLDKT